jgi:hypothetical protein
MKFGSLEEERKTTTESYYKKKVIYSMVTKLCFSIIKIVMFKNFNTIYLNIIYINYVLKNMRAIE